MSNIENDGAIYAWNPAGKGFNPYSGVKNDFRNVTSQIPSNTNTRTRAIVADTAPELFPSTSNTTNPNQFYLNALQALAGYNSGSGSGSGASDKLARDKFEYEKRQDAMQRANDLQTANLASAKDARVLGGFQNYYGGGEGDFNKGFNNLLDMIKTQGAVSEGGITKAYDRATTNIGEGYDAASGLGTTGFNALNQYLAQNQNNPYAGMQASVGSAPDALSNYLSAYGVSDAPVQGQIQADQLQAQQGAGNFQNLIDVLSGVAQQGAGSRGAESQMAQLMFDTGLGQDRAGYQSQAENAQAQALAALQQAMFQSRFGVEGDRNSLANQLAMAVIQAGGNLEDETTEEDDEETKDEEIKDEDTKDEDTGGGGPLPGQLTQTATPEQIVANQLANLLAPAQAQGTSAQQLLDQLNARRGYTPPPAPAFILPPEEVSPEELRRRQIAAMVRR
jgi:hypothetical protein